MNKEKLIYMPPKAELLSCAPALNLLARASAEIEEIGIDGLDGEGDI